MEPEHMEQQTDFNQDISFCFWFQNCTNICISVFCGDSNEPFNSNQLAF